MYRCLLFSLLVLVIAVPIVYADAVKDPCRVLLQNESDLDKVYELSKLVFVAELTPRPGVNRQIYNFRVYDPVLKGDVPEHGFVTFADGCKPMARNTIYVFFLVSLKEKIQGFNAVFLSLPDGPGYTWIADWIDEKILGRQESEVRSQKKE